MFFQKSRSEFSRLPLLAVMLLALACGCGGGEKEPEMAAVTGIVKLDGAPIKGLLVKFEPKAAGELKVGSASSGITDDQGKFTLTSASGKSGAVVGNHTVRINHASEADAPADQQIKAEYNTDSTMTKMVEKGKTNEFTFELTK